MKGKWAEGIPPRHFAWAIKDRLAASERPGGFGPNHRRVRRQEEIIWLRRQGFDLVVSLIDATHNLHNYSELGLPYLHRPFVGDDLHDFLAPLLPELHGHLVAGRRVLLHREELNDRVTGTVAAYLRWSGTVPDAPRVVSVTERLFGRVLGPLARSMVSLVGELPPPGHVDAAVASGSS
jgi:hypothetical protein